MTPADMKFVFQGVMGLVIILFVLNMVRGGGITRKNVWPFIGSIVGFLVIVAATRLLFSTLA